jgi:phytoene dehydrogenase-like protein
MASSCGINDIELMDATRMELQKYLDAKRTALACEVCPERQEYDVVVVGAGLAGLAATITLCNQEKSVLLLEQNDQVGGYAVNFWRGKYRFDGALHSVSGGQPSGALYHALEKLELEDWIQFIPIPAYKMIFDQSTGQALYYDYSFAHFQTILSNRFPQESKQIYKFFSDAQKLTHLILNWNELSFPKKAIRSLHHLSAIPRLMQVRQKNAEEVLNFYFNDEELRHVIFSFVAGMGTPMAQLSAIVFYSMFFEKSILGSHYIRGGSGALTQAMAGKIDSLGGEIKLNARVTHLEFDENNRKSLKKVVFCDNRREDQIYQVYAKNILCCSDPHLLIEDLLAQGSVEPKYIKKIKNRQNTESLFQVYLALDIDLREYGFNAYTNDFYLSDGTILPINIYSNIDPSCAPIGHSVLVSYQLTSIDEYEEALFQDGGKRGEHYKTLKRKKLDEMIEKIAEALSIPDLRLHIKIKEAATPVTYRRYTKNFRGSYVGFMSSVQQIILHPLPFKTPIENLFVAGQWINLGGGFQNTISGGIKAAELILKRL